VALPGGFKKGDGKMKDGDKFVIAYNIMKYTYPYNSRADKIKNQLRIGGILDSNLMALGAFNCGFKLMPTPKIDKGGTLG